MLPQKFRIAIVGGGLAGVASAWHLQQQLKAAITLFDPCGIAGGTSGMAAGLLHPFVGQSGNLNWMGHEGMAATCELLKIAGLHDLPQGLLRPNLNPKKLDRSVQWVDEQAGIFIPQALTIPTKSYLQALWKACEQQGAQMTCQHIACLSELSAFDCIVLATGASLALHSEPLTPVKGQLLEFDWPQASLDCPISAQAYLLKDPEGSHYIAGATYEHTFTNENPDLAYATQEILPKLAALFPSLSQVSICKVRAGMRASTQDRKPLLKQLNDRTWVFSGLGSRGLLYHALFAKKLALSVAQAFHDEDMGFGGEVKEEDDGRRNEGCERDHDDKGL